MSEASSRLYSREQLESMRGASGSFTLGDFGVLPSIDALQSPNRQNNAQRNSNKPLSSMKEFVEAQKAKRGAGPPSLESISLRRGSCSQLEGLRAGMELNPTPLGDGSLKATRPSPLQTPPTSSPQLSNLNLASPSNSAAQLSPMAMRRLGGFDGGSGGGGSFTSSSLKPSPHPTSPSTVPAVGGASSGRVPSLTLASFRGNQPELANGELRRVFSSSSQSPFDSISAFAHPSSQPSLTAAGGGSFSIKRNTSLSKPLKSALKSPGSNESVNDSVLAENGDSSGNLRPLSQSLKAPLSKTKTVDLNGSLSGRALGVPSLERRNSVRWSNAVSTCDPEGVEGMEVLPSVPGGPEMDNTAKGFRLLSKLFGSFGKEK